MATIAITDSVGRKGKNLSDDVKKIQTAMLWLVPGKVPLVDGKNTPDLEAAIEAFQTLFWEKPDGRIDKDKRGIRRINILASNGMVRFHAVGLLDQVSVKKCWEASARMMFAWRNGSLNAYAAAAGPAANEDRGRSEDEMDAFNTALGMRSVRKPKGEDLLHLLASSPVLITGMDKTWGHASVATGYDHFAGTYRINNPAGVTSYDFGDAGNDAAKGTTVVVSMKTIEKELGRYLWYW
jgi:hypothetical protein